MFKMKARVFFPIFTLLLLFQARGAARDTNKSPSSCFCSPVINVGASGNGQCDLCEGNNQLLQEVKDLKKELAEGNNQLLKEVEDLKKELAEIKNQISQINTG